MPWVNLNRQNQSHIKCHISEWWQSLAKGLMSLKISEFVFMEINQSSFWCSNLEKCPDPPSNCHSLCQPSGPSPSYLTHCHQHSSHFMPGQWALISNHPTVAGIVASAVPGAWENLDICFTSLRRSDHELHAVTHFRQAEGSLCLASSGTSRMGLFERCGQTWTWV